MNDKKKEIISNILGIIFIIWFIGSFIVMIKAVSYKIEFCYIMKLFIKTNCLYNLFVV